VGSGSSETLQGRLGAWTEEKKVRMLESRRSSTRLLSEAISKAARPPKVNTVGIDHKIRES